MTSEPPRPRRRPRQARSQAIVQAIHQACEKILVEEGATELTTNRIAEVAGVNIASVYRYFPNKEAIVAELYEAHLAAAAEALDGFYARGEEIDRWSLERSLRLVVDAQADLHLRFMELDADFYRRHHMRFDLSGRLYDRHRRSWFEQLKVWMRSVLERHRDRLRCDDLDRATFIVSHALVDLVRAAVTEAPERLTEPGFREDVVDLALGYLERRT